VSAELHWGHRVVTGFGEVAAVERSVVILRRLDEAAT
jgi:hypothetical protein